MISGEAEHLRLTDSLTRVVSVVSVTLALIGCGTNNLGSSQTGGVPKSSAKTTEVTRSNPGAASTPRDQGRDSTIENSPALPQALVNSIKKNLPGYRIPDGVDLTGRWDERNKSGVPHFFCRGDFNGDGRTDVAIIVIGQNTWRLVIFEQTREGDFLRVYVARPKLRTELAKGGEDTSIEAPQEVILKTIQKDKVWAPEGGDQPYEVKLRTDGIIVEHLKKLRFADLDETTLIEYKDGQYKQSNVLELLVSIEKP